MKIESVVMYNAGERDLLNILHVNDEVLATANYDEHGSAGMDLLYTVAERLADLAGVPLLEGVLEDYDDLFEG